MSKQNIRSQAYKDFWQRYVTIWKAVWNIRQQLDPPKRQKDELAFLPAQLELVETPLSVLPKISARLIMLFAGLALIWSIVGKIDIVAVASGKTSLDGRSKIIQPLETAVVKSILVKNGEQVKVGQVLVELETIGSDSDYTQSWQALKAQRLSKLRDETLLIAIETKKVPQLDKTHAEQWQISEADFAQAQLLTDNQYQTWLAQDQQLQAALRQHQAELKVTQAQVKKLTGLTEIEQQRTDDYKKLLEQNFLSKHAYYEQEIKLIENQNNLVSQTNQLQQIVESIKQAQQSKLLNTQTLKRDTLDALRQANEQIEQLLGQTQRAKQRQSLMSLTSPVDGTVQQLATHTIGGVVTAAQAIMVIVPSVEQIEIEALIENKDIGFVKVGQTAAVKIESFPYTRYGYLTGVVKNISFDAIENEKMGLVFAANIVLDRNYLMIEGSKAVLGAGMNVTAEINTGKRRVIDYFLSPLQTKVDQSLREK